MRVLLVDDDPGFRRYSSLALKEAGIGYVALRTAHEALDTLGAEGQNAFDALLLDVELPGMKGWELLKELRGRGVDMPVILVTVHDALEEKVKGLEGGADDYIVKPFEFEELIARLHAVVRRRLRSAPVMIADLRINLEMRHVERNGQPIELSPREFDVLLVLVQAGGRVVSRRELLKRVWGVGGETDTNVVQVHVSRLRSKLREHGGELIRTQRGKGYSLVL